MINKERHVVDGKEATDNIGVILGGEAMNKEKGSAGMNELDSMCGITDEELTYRFIEAVRIENEIKKIKGVPIAGFDTDLQLPYIEYADGRREYEK